jgi:aspartyl/asparaginyl beta-hydroxylase (cupin superfamily)
MTSAASYIAQSRRLLESGNATQALAESESGLDVYPSDGELQLLRALSLMGLEKYAQAAESLRLLTAANNQNDEAWLRLGACEARLDNPRGAVQAFEQGLRKRPDAFLARLQYAECLLAMGDQHAAVVQTFRAVTTAQSKGRWLNDQTTAPELRTRVKTAMALVDQGRRDLFLSSIEPLVKAHGRSELVRVIAALEMYLGLAKGGSPDPRQRPTFLYVPDLEPRPYFARELFPWYAALESATPQILTELQTVIGARQGLQPFLTFDNGARKSDYLDSESGEAAWDAYFFYRHGQAFDEHLAACPATARTLEYVPLTRIEEHAPEVLFSFLSPGTLIKPHHGVTNSRVVTHLPLIVPENCALEVGGVEHHWEVGRCVTFDDSYSHQAWNHSDQLRVVMILDSWHPGLREPETLALKQLVETIGAFNKQAGVR